jgi:hypothetical protein
MVEIDAFGIMGKKCRKAPVRVDVELRPIGPYEHTCEARDASCSPSGQWLKFLDGPNVMQDKLDAKREAALLLVDNDKLAGGVGECKDELKFRLEECDYNRGGYLEPKLCPERPDSAGECKPLLRYTNVSDVHTFVAFAISF